MKLKIEGASVLAISSAFFPVPPAFALACCLILGLDNA